MNTKTLDKIIEREGLENVVSYLEEEYGTDEALEAFDSKTLFNYLCDNNEFLNRFDDDEIYEECESRGLLENEGDDPKYWDTKYLIEKAAIRLHGKGYISPEEAKKLISDYIDEYFINYITETS